MRQIISGETHKSVKKEVIYFNYDEILKKNKQIYLSLKNKNVFYNNLLSIDSPGLNYFNSQLDNKIESHFKAILKKEYLDCEKLYPHLGNIFLNYLFERKEPSKKNFLFKKDNLKRYVKSEKNKVIREILTIFINNCSLEYNIAIEKSFLNDITLEKNNSLIFKNKFDKDFFNKNKINEYYDYDVFIIDGFIQTVGEIHHILEKSNNDLNNTFVLFCFGMADDVKKTIITNNKKGKTRVFPLSFEFNESNLNFMNDIAVVHNSDIISSLSGQTISQAVRKNNYKKGIKISVCNSHNYFKIEPVCNDNNLKIHLNMLNMKIKDHNLGEGNKEIIIKRIKALNSKSFKIYLPNDLINNYSFLNSLNYYFKFMSRSGNLFNKVKIGKNYYFIPKDFISLAKRKAKSIDSIFNKINYTIQEV
jgi:hypothetical protein